MSEPCPKQRAIKIGSTNLISPLDLYLSEERRHHNHHLGKHLGIHFISYKYNAAAPQEAKPKSGNIAIGVFSRLLSPPAFALYCFHCVLTTTTTTTTALAYPTTNRGHTLFRLLLLSTRRSPESCLCAL